MDIAFNVLANVADGQETCPEFPTTFWFFLTDYMLIFGVEI